MRAWVLFACLATFACGLRAQDVHGYAAIASDYVDRGVALGGSGPLLQLGVDASFASGIVAGAFATTVDRLWKRGSGPARVQLDAYLGYDFGCGGDCRARVLATRYEFPDRSDADWTEWSVSIAPHPRFGASFSHAEQVYSTSFAGSTLEAWYEHPFAESISGQIVLGRIRTRVFDYGYGRVGVTWRHERCSVDLSWHLADEDFREAEVTDDLRHLTATLSYAF